MSEKRTGNTSEINDSLSALITNASAIRAITGAVEGTIGPRGLDTMLVDRAGDIVITNDGVTILDRMEVSHPAARVLINIARAQYEQIGDGTTTATIMAGALVSEGLERILKGVPVTHIIEGIRFGAAMSLEHLKKKTIPVNYPDDPMIKNVAMIAGRGYNNIAEQVTSACKMLTREKIMERSFRMRDIVISAEGSEGEAFEGIIIKKRPVRYDMPEKIVNAKIICFSDGLEPEKIDEASLSTSQGQERDKRNKEEFINNVQKIIRMGINMVLTERGISVRAEEALFEAGVLVITRLTGRQMRQACDYTGAVALRCSALSHTEEELEKFLGSAGLVERDLKLKHVRIEKGAGKPVATVVIGAPTGEVADEKERIAKNAASSVQAAVRAGVTAGGGAAELALSRALSEIRLSLKGMKAFGVDCVIEALKRPVSQIIRNAGFNPLEKVEEVLSAQVRSGSDSLGINCDTGEVEDMIENGIVDPTLIKLHAIKAAAEVAEAILRINTIIKMRDNSHLNHHFYEGS